MTAFWLALGMCAGGILAFIVADYALYRVSRRLYDEEVKNRQD